ncbi:dihydroxyacetone kinase subunit L [Lachnospiraceae bacterium]|uniref:dihydroxyacetone kinase subunit DhaL n=1 Tax=Extibacter sp. GGCC_0201 TaxID=2731209 RepID=UPI001AA1169E|nr:dihydroxyacetone kinase subunit DhaL [Extibacter sp. GGCC_0201]MBO1722426.1 dihydroxyacetone kinase subunit L [Extibacter sp. GGCC_0201]BDF33707.1 dihydroxyacetone kinase subunit L [Lachnospiraceae bacterium]BDF37711.1 dihydroxyacetone kinase subunit L [Lachnospiraceae bacterium]
MEKMNAQQAKDMLLYVADTIIEAKPMLTEVDSAIGDGDHGIGMAGGLKKAKDKLLKMEEPDDVYAVFATAGKAMLMSMGGASGVIFGSMFLGGAKGKEPVTEVGPEKFADMMKSSLAVIKERGKAEVGDKTMVDALSPAVDAMLAYAGEGFVPMLDKAQEAARCGMESTKTFEAKFGRAKTQGTTIGFQDAGATSVWIIVKAMYEYAAKVS